MQKIYLTTLKNKLARFLLKKQEKFYFIIGDEGAILVYTGAGRVKVRLFANSRESAEFQKISEVLVAHPTVPIYVMLDLLDQNYQPFAFPPVSRFSIANLVKRRLEREVPGEAVKGGYFLFKSAVGRRDWHYLLASCPLSEAIKAWLAILHDYPNPLQSIQLLPIEVQTLITHPKIASLYQTENNEDRWEIVILHHKVSGFRQVAFKNKKMVLTRLISTTEENFSDVVAGNMEQEIQNTIEFLRRLADKKEEIKRFHIIVVAANQIVSHIDQKRLAPNVLHVFSPFALAHEIDLEHAATEKDHFSETALAVLCAQSKPVLPLHTPLTQLLQILYYATSWMRKAAPFLGAWLLWGFLSQTWGLWSASSSLSHIEDERQQIEKQYSDLEQRYHLATKKVDEMQDMISLYRLLTADQQSPITILQKFAAVVNQEALLDTYSWNLHNPEDLENRALLEGNQPSFTGSLDVKVLNQGEGFDMLFSTMQDFIGRLSAAFKGYHLQFNRSNQQINFNQSSASAPLNIVISSKTSETEEETP